MAEVKVSYLCPNCYEWIRDRFAKVCADKDCTQAMPPGGWLTLPFFVDDTQPSPFRVIVQRVNKMLNLPRRGYEATARLGLGGFGAVFEVIDHTEAFPQKRHKAIKLQRNLHNEDIRRQMKQKFATELWAAGIFSKHPGAKKRFVEILNRNHETDYIVMEYLDPSEWPTLEVVLRELGTLSEIQAARIGIALLTALYAVHGLNLVHRDIKPENFFVRRSSLESETVEVKLSDFGNAVLINAGPAPVPSLMQQDPLVIYSIDYCAPEQITQGTPTVTVDLFAVACILWRAVVRSHAFRRTPQDFTAASRERLSLTQTLPARPQGMSSDFYGILVGALAYQPGARYASVSDMIGALRSFLNENEAVARARELMNSMNQMVDEAVGLRNQLIPYHELSIRVDQHVRQSQVLRDEISRCSADDALQFDGNVGNVQRELSLLTQQWQRLRPVEANRPAPPEVVQPPRTQGGDEPLADRTRWIGWTWAMLVIGLLVPVVWWIMPPVGEPTTVKKPDPPTKDQVDTKQPDSSGPTRQPEKPDKPIEEKKPVSDPTPQPDKPTQKPPAVESCDQLTVQVSVCHYKGFAKDLDVTVDTSGKVEQAQQRPCEDVTPCEGRDHELTCFFPILYASSSKSMLKIERKSEGGKSGYHPKELELSFGKARDVGKPCAAKIVQEWQGLQQDPKL